MRESEVAAALRHERGARDGDAASIDLFYRVSDERHPLPGWAMSFVILGQCIARAARRGRSLAVVVAPTRGYAATLAATGVAALRQPVCESGPDPDPEARAAHFDAIASLSPHSTVSISLKGRSAVGEFVGVRERHGRRYLVVRERPGRRDELLRSIPEERAYWIEAAGLALSTLLVGQLNVLEEEVMNGNVGTADGLPLQSILKARRFANRRDIEIRSDVVSSVADLPAELRDARPSVVVFDGASTFRRCKEAWTQSSWILILDRSSPDLTGGVELVNQEYAFRRADDDPVAELEPSPGIELLGFWLK